jgi:hypothetical protein
MFIPQLASHDIQFSGEKWLSLGIVALISVESSEIVHGRKRVSMLLAKHTLLQIQDRVNSGSAFSYWPRL